jgi:outer membrane protein assembly factor BamB
MGLRRSGRCLLLAFLVAAAWPVGAAETAAELKEAFLAAARKGDVASVKALLAKGADVNATNAYGATALSYAADKGHLEVVKLLLQHKAKVNVKDSFYNFTPLTWAGYRGHAAVVQALLQADPAEADNALLLGVAGGHVEVVRVTLETGKVKTSALNSALAMLSADQSAMRALLVKAGAKLPNPGTLRAAWDVLAPFTGVYRSQAGKEIRIVFEGDRLALQIDGEPPRVLVPLSLTTFKLSGDEAFTLIFNRQDGMIKAVSLNRANDQALYERVEAKPLVTEESAPSLEEKIVKVSTPQNWPSFRGAHASGTADGQAPPATWNVATGQNIQWKTPIPGLGHSCPIVWGDRVFVTTAISGDPKSVFRPGLYGDVDSVNDNTPHTWRVYCLDKQSGKILWEKTAHQGVPKFKRHLKSSHANPTPASDGRHLVVSFGSEGLYCYSLDGKLLWQRDLGALDSGWFYDPEYQWGFGSSPVIYRDRVIVQCDVGKNSFIAAYNIEDGKPIWQTPREEIPSWATPTVYEGKDRAEVVTNATKFVRGYDPATGKELWRLGRNSEISVPTPVTGAGLIFITSGYRPIQPIYAIRPGAVGDISLKEGADSNQAIAWSKKRGGTYMPTPIVYGDYLYTLANHGVLTCYEAKTGKQVYEKRLVGRNGYTASPIAADGKLYFTSEDGDIRVVRAGPQFQLLATNSMGDPCMATPAISDGMLFVRSQHYLFGIGRGTPPGNGKVSRLQR